MLGNGRGKLLLQVLLTASSFLLHSPLARCQNAAPASAPAAVQAGPMPDVRALADFEIVEVHGAGGEPPYLVRFDDGHTGLVFPGPDAVVLLGGQVGAKRADLEVGHLVEVGRKRDQRVACGERVGQLGAGELAVKSGHWRCS